MEVVGCVVTSVKTSFDSVFGFGAGFPVPKIAFSIPNTGDSKAKVATIEAHRVIPNSAHQRRI